MCVLDIVSGFVQVESSGADGERESGGVSGPPAPTVSQCMWCVAVYVGMSFVTE